MKSLFKKIIVSFLILIMIPIGVGAVEYNYTGHSDKELYMRGRTMDMNIPFIEVDDMQAYCAEYTKDVPHGIGYLKADGRVGYDSLGILAIIYHGYPINGTHMQEKYNLNDDEALMLTQYSLWNYIEGWNRGDATEPYAKELLSKGDNEEVPEENFVLDENKLIYKEKDDFLETDYISLNGKNGRFTIKTDEGTKVYDEAGRERYNYEDGEKFMVRNVSRQKEESIITITGSYDMFDLEVYEPEDTTYQDLIRAGENTRELNETYTVHRDMAKARGIVQTGDKEGIYLAVIMIGCVVWVVLNMDLKKKCR